LGKPKTETAISGGRKTKTEPIPKLSYCHITNIYIYYIYELRLDRKVVTMLLSGAKRTLNYHISIITNYHTPNSSQYNVRDTINYCLVHCRDINTRYQISMQSDINAPTCTSVWSVEVCTRRVKRQTCSRATTSDVSRLLYNCTICRQSITDSISPTN